MRYKQIGANTILFSLGVTVPLFIEKVIIHPFLLRAMGEAAFGEFVVALAVVLMISIIPANSVAQTLIREHTRFEGNDKALFFRTCLLLNVILLIILFTGIVIFSEKIGILISKNDSNTGSYLRTLALYGILFGSIPILQGFFRLRLEFKHFLVTGLGLAAGSLLVIAAVNLAGTAYIGLIYSLCACGGVLTAIAMLGRRIFSVPLFDISTLPLISKISFFLAGGTILALLQSYLARIYLGAKVEPALVSQFFAANSIALLFAEPASIIGRVAFSYVSTWRKIENCPRSLFFKNIIISMCIIAAIAFIGVLFGKMVLQLLYPSMAVVAYPFFLVRLLGRIFASIRAALFGWVAKFLVPWTNTVVVAFCFVINVVLLVMLVKPMGVMGAAIACTCSDIFVGLSYLLLIIYLYRLAGRDK